MSEDTSYQIESLESWLSTKPYWEQYVWKLNFEKDLLSEEDIEKCYQYLNEHLGLIPPSTETKKVLSFVKEIDIVPGADVGLPKIKIIEVKKINNVNALTKECSIKFGPSLTLVYGGNGTGKSGVGRLLCNACFSRGERELLPNVREASTDESKANATFVINNDSGQQSEINYSLGDNYTELKCFSVFDSKSVLIHLDKANEVKFTPAQIKIFDRVANTITRIEKKLTDEKNRRKKDNPFESMFLNEDSAIAQFCHGINASTKEEDFITHANFDDKADNVKVVKLVNLIDEKKKLDIQKKKIQLGIDRQSLVALKRTLQDIVNKFTEDKAEEINRFISDIQEKKTVLAGISIENFDDRIFKTIGSTEWKSLIEAAKVLYNNEKAASGQEVKYCVLCHQRLSKDAETLFQKYWQFLESKAEVELAELMQKQAVTLQDLRKVQTTYPKFLDTDAGIKVLQDDKITFLTQLKTQFAGLSCVLSDWIIKIENIQKVNRDKIPAIDLHTIDSLISAKTTEESKLVDPSDEIASLLKQLIALRHKKAVTDIKGKIIEYLNFLKWSEKANSISFAGIKMAVTKKRTEFFNIGIAMNYKTQFNDELKKLGCKFDLVMLTSGVQGNTVKEYRIDFAEEYNPSQILSEGEQNVCSLADFLTEMQLDKNNCGIFFDDPVSSLDHERKEKIAERLVVEAQNRQVIIFTHDKVFLSYLARNAEKHNVNTIAHWMKKVNDIPGYVEENASPKLACLSKLKEKYDAVLNNYSFKKNEEQELLLGSAFDLLRDACEALIEEKLFAGAVQRWEDHIRVHNLEEAVFDQKLALEIVCLFGRISDAGIMHNRSDSNRENTPTIEDFNILKKIFEELETKVRDAQKKARKERGQRKDISSIKNIGW